MRTHGFPSFNLQAAFGHKRVFLVFALAGIIWLSAGVMRPGAVLSEVRSVHEKSNQTVAEAFVNEALTYKIGFWVFDDVAIGKVSLKRGADGDYVATLNAYTTGRIVSWLFRSRHDTYLAHLRMSADGKRFITKTFEKNTETVNKKKRSITSLDYEKGLIVTTNYEDGKETSNTVIPLQKGLYFDDPLAAFYNFRFGVYGGIEPGKDYNIYTFPSKDHVPVISIRIAGKGEVEKRFDGNMLHSYLAEVKLGKDLFGSKSGFIEIEFTNDMIPEAAVAKDILFYGDVRGKLTSIGAGTGLKNKAATEE